MPAQGVNKMTKSTWSGTKPLAEWFNYFAENTIKADISYRGGVLKIDAGELFPGVEDAIIWASQGYLGGGIAGAITRGAMFSPDDLENEKQRALFNEALEAAKRYFYNLNNGGGDEYMQEHVTGADAGGYEANQSLATRAY